MEKENKNLRVPKETKEDYNYDRIRALVSASGVPFATDIFGVLFTKPIEKRRKEFLQSILDKIEELSKNIEKFEPENLQKNEVFLSTLVKSCQSILNEHQKIKIDSFKNIVINSVSIEDIDEEMKMFLLSILDSLSTLQIKLLTYYVGKTNASSIKTYRDWREQYSSYQNFYSYRSRQKEPILNEEQFIMISKDLENKGLHIRTRNFDGEGFSNGYTLQRSELADNLLKYISGHFGDIAPTYYKERDIYS